MDKREKPKRYNALRDSQKIVVVSDYFNDITKTNLEDIKTSIIKEKPSWHQKTLKNLVFRGFLILKFVSLILMKKLIVSEYLRIIQIFKLEFYFHILLTENTGATNPYHNNYHILTVFTNCYRASKKERLEKKKTRLLLIAALFHDFNHSAGKFTDDVNVKNSISSFWKYSVESEIDSEKIVEIIKATQYPYVISENELFLEQKIIRDCDLMQWYENNYLQQVFYGLSQEMNLNFKTSPMLYVKFIEGMKPMTNYGKFMYEKYMQKRKNDLNFIEKLINIK